MDELLDQHAEAARERWFGAQAAASYLGLHRSTLFLAVQRKHLIPDQFTPGGHARFRQATLEAFRNLIAKEAATSDTPLYAPVHTLADLAHAVNNVAPPPNSGKLIRDKDISDEVRQVCTSAVVAITSAPLRIPSCLIALRVSDQHDPFALRMAAQQGVTRGLLRDYEWLRHQANTSFATMDALDTCVPIYCQDTSDPSMLRNGSAQLIKEHHIGAYAIVPIVGGDVALGALLLISHEPRAFTTHERTFLRGVADQVTTAVTNQSRADRLCAYTKAGRDLTQLALAFRAQATTSSDPSMASVGARDALLQLMGVFLEGADAASVCALGFAGGDTLSAHKELNALTARALTETAAPPAVASPAAPGNHQRERAVDRTHGYVEDAWMSQGAPVSALAISVPLDGQRRAAIGAMWRRSAWSDEDHLLLVTLAGACAMAPRPA
ncbi:MAG TPA: GAF domain-containing protein [Ktedonobacterales bacterium]|nr:GAF domain-containing protein [Ktedonobacterales bacterium]